MAFDTVKFTSQVFCPRTGRYEVAPHSGLRQFFGEDDEKVFLVRGLTASEVGITRDATTRNRDIAALLEALTGGESSEKAQAMQQLIRPETPDDVARRLEVVHLGLVDPKLNFPDVVRLAENFPIEFYGISDQILMLTGLGRLPGKPESSTASR